MKIIKTMLAISLAISSAGPVYALRPISSALQAKVGYIGSDGNSKASSAGHREFSRRKLLSKTAALTAVPIAASMMAGCQHLESFTAKFGLSSGRYCAYEYLPYFTDVKVPLRQSEGPAVAPKAKDEKAGVLLPVKSYEDAFSKPLSYEEKEKLFIELFRAYDEGDRSARREVLYFIDAVIKKRRNDRITQVWASILLRKMLGYDTPVREELMDLICDAQTSISEPLRGFIYTCLKHKVSWFTRFYPADFRTIIEHRVTRKTHPRKAIYIGPVEDKEGAFAKDKTEFRELLRAGYDISYYEARYFTDVVEALKKEKESGPADLIIFSGHGKQDALALGMEDLQSTTNDLERSISIMHEYQFTKHGLNDCLKEKGVVIINSCNSGEEKATERIKNASDMLTRILNQTTGLPAMNLANMFARIFDQAAHVLAPTGRTKKCEIGLGRDKEVTGVEYDCPAYDAAEALRKLRKRPESARIHQSINTSA